MFLTKTRQLENLALIRKMYLDDKFAAWKIAEILGVDKGTVLRRLRELGITRTGSQASRNRIVLPYKKLDMNLIKRLYLIDKLSTGKIAERLGTTQYIVWDRLQKLNILRNYSEAADNYWGSDYIDENLLKNKYFNEKETLVNIANDFGVSCLIINSRIRRLGIEKRPNIQIDSHHSEEQNNKQKFTMRNLWKDPLFRAKQSVLRHRKPSIHEQYYDNLIQSNFPNIWHYTGDFSLWICNVNPDWTSKDKKKVLEYNSCAYHCCPICDRKHPFGLSQEWIRNRDISRSKILKENGYDMLIFWTHESDEQIINRIRSFIN